MQQNKISQQHTKIAIPLITRNTQNLILKKGKDATFYFDSENNREKDSMNVNNTKSYINPYVPP